MSDGAAPGAIGRHPALDPVRALWARRRDALGAVVYWTGMARVFEAVARPEGAIILMYHSVAGPEEARFIDPPNRISPQLFERQMAFLRARRRVVSLSEVVARLVVGESPRAGTVCLTFDDGYLDNLTVVAPILASYGLPATIFLATGYVERRENQWADTLHWMVAARTAQIISLPELGITGINLASRRQRLAARRRIHRHLLESTAEERRRTLGDIRKQLAPAGKPPRLTMDWNEARELRRRYPMFEIGGHTRDHLDLRTHAGATALEQIQNCAEDLRREVGIETPHFSYPYSRWSRESRSMVERLGWKAAVGEHASIRITAASDRFALPRVECPRSMTQLRFKTGGSYPGSLALVGHGG